MTLLCQHVQRSGSQLVVGVLPDIPEGFPDLAILFIHAMFAGFVELLGGTFKQGDASFKQAYNLKQADGFGVFH